MRLLNTRIFELKGFFTKEAPSYVILSHRWDEIEITFKDVMKRRNLHAAGWSKVRNCCSFARKRGYQWVWIDTCCIDKRSSAELSESINSMYNWYKDAEECYAYLNDVPYRKDSHGGYCDKAAFQASKWFTREWTLQELLVPDIVLFVDKDWQGTIGSKATLRKIVSEVTGIQNLGTDWRLEIIATKMSWASQKVCTREEDLAYCLLGLFNVNMPLLYGEGSKAFFRLQLEILKSSDNETMFAWYPDTNSKDMRAGMLADSPAMFKHSSQYRPVRFEVERPPYSMTNKGLEFRTVLGVERAATLRGYRSYRPGVFFLLPLNCSTDGKQVSDIGT